LLILKTERCWSGRSGTLGKRSRPTPLRDIKTLRYALDSTSYALKMLLDVTP
jgi:hypothetical protein